MRLFKGKKVPLNAAQQAVAERIADKIVSRQKSLADYLNTKTQRISGRSWLWLLIGFCLVFGCYCLKLVLAAWM
ncbi:hypothetical protein SAMN04487898_12290 [Pedobacter sp. ok626]|uniref:hypothetical protein n=1 Tax=Pedobacter sp. ok626 TaxID=1761882 RepID=UPI000891ED8C|nr:hypothetical protein [Pedobacter sp. ok626]SDL67605.1 hypothetical protein SAMN04487898_12290 [Pedobacter sp. ok626]